MNKIYLLVPLLLLLAFAGVHTWHQRDADARRALAAAEAERVAAVEAGKRSEAERFAREDAERRAKERLAEERRLTDEKRAKREAERARIDAETEAFLAQARKLAAEAKALEARLVALQEEKERTAQATFDLAKQVEAARVAKRNAELETQRLVEMLARRAGTTLLPEAKTP